MMPSGLSQLLSGLWNKIKRGSSSVTLHISEEDLVVFVVGPTGSGKSWFTREATKSDLVKPSRDHHPSTGRVQAIKCELADEAKKDPQLEGIKNIVFVDSPSFLTGCDDPDARKEFEKWFRETEYKPRSGHVGAIYMHRVETEPRLEPIKDHFHEFSTTLLVGNAPGPWRIHVVVSYDRTSGTVSPEKRKDRIVQLREQLQQLENPGRKTSMHKDLFQGDPEVAWSAVAELFKG